MEKVLEVREIQIRPHIQRAISDALKYGKKAAYLGGPNHDVDDFLKRLDAFEVEGETCRSIIK